MHVTCYAMHRGTHCELLQPLHFHSVSRALLELWTLSNLCLSFDAITLSMMFLDRKARAVSGHAACTDRYSSAFQRGINETQPMLWCVQELVDTVVLAMTKNKTLCSMALALLQKLLLNKALSADGRRTAIETLRELAIGRAHEDESTRLKLLQTCLSFLQLPGTTERPEESRKVGKPRDSCLIMSVCTECCRHILSCSQIPKV